MWSDAERKFVAYVTNITEKRMKYFADKQKLAEEAAAAKLAEEAAAGTETKDAEVMVVE